MSEWAEAEGFIRSYIREAGEHARDGYPQMATLALDAALNYLHALNDLESAYRAHRPGESGGAVMYVNAQPLTGTVTFKTNGASGETKP